MELEYSDEEKYTKNILNRIKKLMRERNITQSELSAKCGIGQSTFSKIMKGQVKLSLNHIYKICKALNIEPEYIFSSEQIYDSTKAEAAFSNTGIINKKILNTQIFIRDTSHPAFKGYINNTYFIYLYPTISGESTLLHGEISFENKEPEDYCSVILTLYTGQTNSKNEKVRKEYYGELIISLTMGACYTILINSDIGEICFLNFKHSFLFNQDLICKTATLSSTSSGGNRLPIIQRALLSKQKLELTSGSTDLDFIKGQLKLNDSEIIISKKDFENLPKTDTLYPAKLIDFFSECQNLFDEAAYVHIDEAMIRAINASPEIKSIGISILRNISTALKYNKISSKTDEYVFNYINNKANSYD